MNHNRIRMACGLFALFFALCALLPGCGPAGGKPTPGIEASPGVEASAGQAAREALEYLTSAECAGRAVGTQGNARAVEYIRATLEGFSYQPLFGESLLVPYLHQNVVLLDQSQYTVALTANGKREELVCGEDFFPFWYVEPFETEAELAVWDGQREISGMAALLHPSSEIIAASAKNPALLVLESDFPACSPHSPQAGKPGQVWLTAAGMQKARGAQRISVACNAAVEDEQQHNIIALKQGLNRNKAVLITAHLDHVGYAGGFAAQGAVDNASGVAALLGAAEKLAEGASKYDVVFCAFNGEEEGLQGSAAIARELAGAYEQIVVINLDCVGVAESGRELFLDATVSGGVGSYLANALTRQGFIFAECDLGTPSDQLSFRALNQGIDAVALLSPDWMDYAHSPLDTTQAIDLAILCELGAAVADCARGYDFAPQSNSSLPVSENGPTEQQREASDQARAKAEELLSATPLAYDEMLIFDMPDGTWVATGNRLLLPGEIALYYPGLALPAELAGLPLGGLLINTTAPEYVDHCGSLFGQILSLTHYYGNGGDVPKETPVKRACFAPELYYNVSVFYQGEERRLQLCLANTRNGFTTPPDSIADSDYQMEFALDGEFAGVTVYGREAEEAEYFDYLTEDGACYVTGQYFNYQIREANGGTRIGSAGGVTLEELVAVLGQIKTACLPERILRELEGQ